MAFPKGNQFWKLRSVHGRDKIFNKPEMLWNEASKYFEWCDENPWMRAEQLKKPVLEKKGNEETWVTVIALPTARPYTLTALCLFLGVNTKYFSDFKDGLAKDETKLTQEEKDAFSEVITRIEQTIYTQKFEGAAVGAFNPNIIARDLGLADKKEHSGEVGIKQITGMEVK